MDFYGMLAQTRRDGVLDQIGVSFPAGPCPTVADLTECVETALGLLGLPWVWYLTSVETRNGFAKLLSAVTPLDLLVSDSVYAYCRVNS